tara:strand:+ start:18059 stop:18352 length:294 start_codon:yes stop_codon:yes gene_type:complete
MIFAGDQIGEVICNMSYPPKCTDLKTGRSVKKTPEYEFDSPELFEDAPDSGGLGGEFKEMDILQEQPQFDTDLLNSDENSKLDYKALIEELMRKGNS